MQRPQRPPEDDHSLVTPSDCRGQAAILDKAFLKHSSGDDRELALACDSDLRREVHSLEDVQIPDKSGKAREPRGTTHFR